VITALLTPTVLVSGWLVGGALQSTSYSPMRQTMSVLAGQAAADRWVMTGALIVVGACQILTGVGLTSVRLPARVLLVITGLSTLGIAASPEPAGGPSFRHMALAVSCVVTTAVWPAFVARRERGRSRILGVYPAAGAVIVFAGLAFWLLVETQGGSALGMVERLTSAAEGLWPLVIVLAIRQAARAAPTARPVTGEEPEESGLVPQPRLPT
jgi:hypothetical membrane protein